MKEDFLHYLWKFKKFDTRNLKTFHGEDLTIVNCGQYAQIAGPDFFNAQIIIGDQKWAGNVEIHLKSSDWYLHRHETDKNYENIILHVVWEHDTEIFRANNVEIPVLQLNQFVDRSIIENYKSLTLKKSWIFCEKQFKDVSQFVIENWQERLFFERLERKSALIFDLLTSSNNDWEAVLFCLLAKNFGLNSNGEVFLKIAKSLPFTLIRKESAEVENIEALLLGRAGLLELQKEDTYYKDLQFRYFYLIHKYQLSNPVIEPVHFFKHRPDNFPTIRLSQFANLYHKRHNLFSLIVAAKSQRSIYNIFQIETSQYWKNHYQFDRESPSKPKKLSKSFIDLIIINTLIPIQFAYNKSLGKEISSDILNLITEVAAEKNTVIEKFNSFGIQAKNAFCSQALLELKNEYCSNSKCLECAIGLELLKSP